MEKKATKYWCSDTMDWQWEELQLILLQDMLQEFATVQVSSGTEAKDKYCWKGDSKGLVSLCSICWSLLQFLSGNKDPKLQKVWKMKGPQQLAFLIWLIRWQGLTTSSYLLQCGILEDNTCPICKEKQEKILHAVRDCPWIQDI